jgi:hypothetical protein
MASFVARHAIPASVVLTTTAAAPVTRRPTMLVGMAIRHGGMPRARNPTHMSPTPTNTKRGTKAGTTHSLADGHPIGRGAIPCLAPFSMENRMSQQPKWKFVSNLGDASPLDYGGDFLFIDETGVYPPELEHLELADPTVQDDDKLRYTIHRVVLENCTFVKGVLSDNKFHPDYPVWFARKDPEHKARHGYDQWSRFCDTAKSVEMTGKQLAKQFCDEDPEQRALAWKLIIDANGWHEFDEYPHTNMTRKEVIERYKEHPEIEL